jgi:hypothetical protein
VARRDPLEAASDVDASDIGDEYQSFSITAPSWAMLSVLAATPGVLLPWFLPALIMNVGWGQALRRILWSIPVSAAFGVAFAVVELRRRGRNMTAIIGLILNLALLAASGWLGVMVWLR